MFQTLLLLTLCFVAPAVEAVVVQDREELETWMDQILIIGGGDLVGTMSRPLDMRNVPDLSNLFKEFCSSCPNHCLRAGGYRMNIEAWDVSAVRNMSGMFEGCNIEGQRISAWDTGNVIDMS